MRGIRGTIERAGLASLTKLFALVCSVSLIAACGGGGGGGGTVTATVTPVGGVWTITETSASDDCGAGVTIDPAWIALITQSGINVTLIDDDGASFSGTISGTTLSVSGTSTDPSGDTFVGTVNATVTGDTMTGTVSIVATGPSFPSGCNINASFTGVRKSTMLNGSFETGDFTNWVTQDLSTPYAGLTAGNGPMVPLTPPGPPPLDPAPSDGTFAVRTGFDGNGGPGNDKISVAQDVDLSGRASAAVSFDWAVTQCVNSGSFDRVFSLEIEPAGGGASLFSQTIFTCLAGGGNSTMSPVNDQVIDISAVAGQAVRIKFQWLVPESFTGPAGARLDDVKLIL